VQADLVAFLQALTGRCRRSTACATEVGALSMLYAQRSAQVHGTSSSTRQAVILERLFAPFAARLRNDETLELHLH
jgi:hypothetical protein